MSPATTDLLSAPSRPEAWPLSRTTAMQLLVSVDLGSRVVAHVTDLAALGIGKAQGIGSDAHRNHLLDFAGSEIDSLHGIASCRGDPHFFGRRARDPRRVGNTADFGRGDFNF